MDWLSEINPQVLTNGFIYIQILILLACIYRYITPVAKRKNELNHSLALTAEIKRKYSDTGKRREEAERTLFKKVPWAQELFKSFTASWKDALPSGKTQAAVSISLRTYLTPQAVIHSAANQRTSETLPGILLAIGIFGTFLGLVLGLSNINLSTSNINDSGIEKLVEGLSLAFLTSLVGILSSISFSFIQKGTVRRLEDAVFKLDRAMSELYPCVTEEYYGRKLIEVQSGMLVQLKTLSTDIGMAVSQAVEPAMKNAVSAHLQPIIQDMKDLLQQHLAQSAQSQADAAKGILTEATDLLTKTFASQVEEISKMIEQTTIVQSQIREEMSSFSEHMKKQFSVQSELIEKTSQAGQILNDSLESLGSISTDLKSSANDVMTAAEVLSESAKQAREGQQEMRQTIEKQISSLSSMREELDKSWSTITSGAEGLTSHVGNLVEQMAESLGDQLKGALNSFDSKLAEVLGRFSGTLLEMKDTVDELPNFLGELSASADAISTRIDDQKVIFEELRDLSKNLVAPNIQQAVEAGREFSSSISKINEAASALTNEFSKIDVKAEAFLENFQKTVSDATTSNDEPDNSKGWVVLEPALKDISAIRSALSDDGDGSLKKLWAQFEGVQQKTAAASASGSTALMDIRQKIDQIATSINGLRSALETEQGRKGFFDRFMRR